MFENPIYLSFESIFTKLKKKNSRVHLNRMWSLNRFESHDKWYEIKGLSHSSVDKSLKMIIILR